VSRPNKIASPDDWLSQKDLIEEYEELPVKSGNHIRKLEREGKFPKGVKLSPRRKFWRRWVIEAHIKAAETGGA